MSLVKINLQLDELKKILDELVVKEERQYKVALGKTVASALSGFLAGFYRCNGCSCSVCKNTRN